MDNIINVNFGTRYSPDEWRQAAVRLRDAALNAVVSDMIAADDDATISPELRQLVADTEMAMIAMQYVADNAADKVFTVPTVPNPSDQ